MAERNRERNGWKDMGTHTRVYFVLSMVLIGFGLVGLLASFIFTGSSWIEGFYTASLYGNTAGVLLLLVTSVRISKDAERFRAAAKLQEEEPKADG